MGRFRTRAAFGALAIASCTAALAQVPEAALDMGTGVYGMRMYVLRDTVRREGTAMRYELRGRDADGASWRAAVRIDCARRARVEERSTFRQRIGGLAITAPTPVPEMQLVYEGTRQSDEVDRMCREFANSPETPGGVIGDAAAKQALDAQKVQDAWDYFEWGLRAAREGDRRSAINRIGAGVKLHFDYPMMLLLANLCEAEGKDDAALVAWQWVLAKAPNAEDKKLAAQAIGRLGGK